MPNLTPVDYDPFEQSAQTKLTPVDYDPFEQPTLETPVKGISTAEDAFVRQPLRAGRSAVVGAASLLDAPRIVTDPALEITGWAAKKMGFPETGEYISTQAKAPYFGEMTREGIDKATGDYLKPRNTTEKVADFVDEIGFAAMTPKALSDVVKTATTKVKQLSVDDLKKAANAAYTRAKEMGGTLKPTFTDDFVNKSKGSLLSGDEVVDAMKANKPLAEAVKDLELLKGQPMTLERAQAVDETLSNMIDSTVQANGSVNKVGKKLLDVQNTLRSMMDDVSDDMISGGIEGIKALKEGRDLWSRQARLSDIRRIITRADMTDNPATAIKTGFRTLYSNPKRMRGFTEAEKKAIEKAARSGVAGDILRTFGSRLIPIGTTLTGGGLGGTAAAQAGTMASRNAATALQVKRAEKVADMIAGTKTIPGLDMKIPKSAAVVVGSSPLQERIKR